MCTEQIHDRLYSRNNIPVESDVVEHRITWVRRAAVSKLVEIVKRSKFWHTEAMAGSARVPAEVLLLPFFSDADGRSS